MSDTKTGEIELGTQVTTPFGTGVVTWVEVGGDEFQVLRYGRPLPSFGGEGVTGSGPDTVTVDRAHIDFWPPRNAAKYEDHVCSICGDIHERISADPGTS